MKGLQGNLLFSNFLTSVEKQTLRNLAKFEKEDADRCASCGGEDCICCEYYQDRQKWKSPDELFAHEIGDPMYDDYDYHTYYESEEWV